MLKHIFHFTVKYMTDSGENVEIKPFQISLIQPVDHLKTHVDELGKAIS